MIIEIEQILANMNVMLTRWSDYTIIEEKGCRYILPAKGATAVTYSCTEHLNALVPEALDLGRMIDDGLPGAEDACLRFAAQYGLLGLSDPTSEDTQAPSAQPMHSEKYGEALEAYQYEFRKLYRNFRSICNYSEKRDSRLDTLYGTLRFRLSSERIPHLVWEIDSLRTVLEFAYASMVTEDPMPLRCCKRCEKIYYNPHIRSEFCSTRCRNYYNVKMYRAREKEK